MIESRACAAWKDSRLSFVGDIGGRVMLGVNYRRIHIKSLVVARDSNAKLRPNPS